MKKIVKIIVSGVIGFATTYTTSFNGANLGDVSTLLDFVLSSLIGMMFVYLLLNFLFAGGDKSSDEEPE